MRDGAEKQKIIVLGAASAMAEAASRHWAEQGAHILLAGRNAARLDEIADDLRLRGAQVETHVADLASGETAKSFRGMADRLGGVDVVLLAYGVLGDQTKAEAEPKRRSTLSPRTFRAPRLGVLKRRTFLNSKVTASSLSSALSQAIAAGRRTMYTGPLKAGLAVLVQGIAHRLAKSGAAAVLIKPGFVDSPMTAHIATQRPFMGEAANYRQDYCLRR